MATRTPQPVGRERWHETKQYSILSEILRMCFKCKQPSLVRRLPCNTADFVGSNAGKSPNVQMMLDATITVPGDGTSVTVPAHVVPIGTIGNIPIRGWTNYFNNLPVDITNITPFTGGTDPQSYTIVKQSDIDTAANSLKASTRQSAVADLNSQLRPNEHLVGDPQCTYNVTSDHAVGDQATTVTVTVKATCTATAST